VDVLESRITGLLRGRPDNPFAEAGLKSEITRHGLRSRRGQHRADLMHQPLDYVFAAVPWVLVGSLALTIGRALRNGSRNRKEDRDRGQYRSWDPDRGIYRAATPTGLR
jgi:hypothetical protein